MRQKLILYEMNYHVPYCMRCTCQAQRDVHLEQHEMYISCVQSLLFQEKKYQVRQRNYAMDYASIMGYGVIN